jgi:predicted ATPase
MIGGEAGIGKTALVDAFCRQLNVAKASNVARGQCIQGVCCKEDYYPVMEAIGELCASPSGGDVCRTLRTMAPAWMIHTAISQSKTVQAAPIGQHPRIIGDLCHALEEISAEMPLLLLFEDMEWADESTLNLISALARRRVPTRLMVLITYRPAKGSALQALKQDLLMRRLCKDIALTPLRKDAVRGLLSGELAQQLLPAGLETFVYRRAEGNPLFATAIVKHLISERILVHRGSEGRWELSVDLDEIDAGVPEELAQMIEMEIGRLADDEQQMLEAGSLMQVAFPSWAVAAALEEDESEVEAKCDALARRLYFVDRAGQDELPDGAHSAFYVFGHGLYREMLYQRQAATRRGERHIRIAERLSELFAGREADVAREMAMHFEAGGDWKRAAQALHMAAVRAEERHAYADAAESLEHALRIVENLPEKYRACEARDLLRILKEARAALGAGASSSEEGHAKV